MNKCKFLLVLFLVELLFCSGEDNNGPRHDYFKLALQWPNSYCLTSDEPCRRKVPQFFTINGLWPEVFIGKQPANCSTPQQLTNTIIAYQKYDLLKYWPSLSTYNFEDSMGLWKDQWEIHGSCASDIISPEDYLARALNLRQAHNLFDTLALSDIRADGRSYRAEDILHAISKVTRFWVNIVCKKDKLGNVYLAEIHQCIDYAAKEFINCQDMAMNCDEDPIIFPDQKFIPSYHYHPLDPDTPNCPKPHAKSHGN